MKPLLLPLLAAMVAGCCPKPAVLVSSGAHIGGSYYVPPQGCHKVDCNTECCQGNLCTSTTVGCSVHLPVDIAVPQQEEMEAQ